MILHIVHTLNDMFGIDAGFAVLLHPRRKINIHFLMRAYKLLRRRAPVRPLNIEITETVCNLGIHPAFDAEPGDQSGSYDQMIGEVSDRLCGQNAASRHIVDRAPCSHFRGSLQIAGADRLIKRQFFFVGRVKGFILALLKNPLTEFLFCIDANTARLFRIIMIYHEFDIKTIKMVFTYLHLPQNEFASAQYGRENTSMRLFEGYRKGVNLGGWLSQCVHTKEHYDTFITEKDIEFLAGLNIDHVRVPVDFELVETPEGAYIEAGFAYIDTCIAWCEKYNLHMILDLHKTAGYCFDQQDTTGSLFTSEEIKLRFIRLWEQFAARYGHRTDRLAFELLNEVVDEGVIESWNRIIYRTVESIRSIAPDIKILVGGVFYNSVTAVKYLDRPYDSNIVYNFHCYDPLLFTHQAAHWIKNMPSDVTIEYPTTIDTLKKGVKGLEKAMSQSLENPLLKTTGPEFFEILFAEAIAIAEERDVPLYCGEYGVIDQAPAGSTLNWYRDINSVFEKHNIGRAMWTYKKMNFGFIEDHYAPVYSDLIRYF